MAFTKVLIANRGEIACRIMRTSHAMGYRTVAVYSEADGDAPHVQLADQAVCIGPAPVAESYLNVSAILAAAARTGADAVHPGYGFLAENAAFAQACADAGLTFIGPSPKAIDLMGNKRLAKLRMADADVPCVPGYSGADQDDGVLTAEGESIGFPLMVKAASGGGGRGMRLVENAADLPAAITGARSEAENAFGSGELILEKAVIEPRHVEIQVFADSRGNCVHLGERDCSIQRRHQKVVEEAPSPAVGPELRAAMGAAAVAAAQAINYQGAGTVEFLLGADGSFFFLEMNTRLQVEHPVTELVTGLDLVEQQLRIAAGEPLAFTQEDVEIRGHAIEVRINAEDPAGGAFLPSPGRITQLRAPDGFGVRFDTGFEAGDEVSQFYDNLIGKLIVWGADRDTAIRRILRALGELEVTGVATTAPADVAILEHPDFVAATHSTKWVEETLDLTGVGGGSGEDADAPPGSVRRDTTVEVDGRRIEVSIWVPDPAEVGTLGGRPRRASAGPNTAGGVGNGQVAVPMQGTIVKVVVEVGDTVAAGDTVCVLEAMKMENNVVADVGGTVTEVKVAVGDSVGSGDVVVVIEPG